MSPGSPLEAAERSLGQVVVPVGRSDTFGAAHRPAPWRRDVTRPGGPSIHRPDACPSSAGARRGRASPDRHAGPGAGRAAPASRHGTRDRPLAGDVDDAPPSAWPLRGRARHGRRASDPPPRASPAWAGRRRVPSLGRTAVPDRESCDGPAIRRPWPGRAAGAWRSKPAQPWLWAVRSGPCWVRTSVSRSGLRSASRRATVCSSARARRSVRASARRSVRASAPRSGRRPGLGSDPRPVLRSAPGSRPVRVTGAAVRSECRGADVGGWLGAALGVAVGSLGDDDGIGGGVPVAPGRALAVGGGAATALGTGVGAEVGATALGTGVGPLGPLTLAVGAGVEAGGGRTATAVGVALGRTPVGSGEDPARGGASLGAGVAVAAATSPPPGAGPVDAVGPDAVRSCCGGNTVPTAKARTTRPRLTPPRATTSRWRCVGDSSHLP